jgi:hypothetical protein
MTYGLNSNKGTKSDIGICPSSYSPRDYAYVASPQMAKGPQDVNNFSLVIAFQYAGKVALLCADALKDHWKDAFKELQRAKIQKASILKVPHHGASNAFHLNPKFKHELNSWDLCEGKPVAVLFAGDINHPDLEVLNELQKRTHLFSLFDPFAVSRNTSPITLDTIGAEPVPTGRRQLRHCRVIVQTDASGQISYSTVDV